MKEVVCYTNRENVGKLDVLKAKISGADGWGVNNWDGHLMAEEASLAKGLQEVRDLSAQVSGGRGNVQSQDPAWVHLSYCNKLP